MLKLLNVIAQALVLCDLTSGAGEIAGDKHHTAPAVLTAWYPKSDRWFAESFLQNRGHPIGDQELALLRFVSEAAPVTVGQAAERFGQPRNLARSTVLTMMERLRKKGHLTRKLQNGLYHYAPRTAHGVAVREAVRNFVDRTLDGSIAPFVAYLGERNEVSDEELAELKAQLARLQGQRRKKG